MAAKFLPGLINRSGSRIFVVSDCDISRFSLENATFRLLTDAAQLHQARNQFCIIWHLNGILPTADGYHP